ncbi:MAG: hypothetical protein PVF87_04440 [Acidimicrobiia bacterium]|jgi:hypothetical protein
MDDQPDWQILRDLDDWVLTIYPTPDYSLLTDFELVAPDSARYLGTIGTPEMLREIIDKPEEGAPLWISDLVLVDHLSEQTIVTAARALIDGCHVAKALDLADPQDPDDEWREDD